MKFVIAPDKFKGSLTGFEYCNAVSEGLRMVFPDANIIMKPLADGGDGTIEVVKHYLKGEKISVTVNDPLFRPINASYLYSKKNQVAYIEMAEASGLALLTHAERSCMNTSTFGTGELISNALKLGAQEIILGIGGSATNDGGMGMASALGYNFLDKNHQALKPIGCHLIDVESIDDSQIHVRLKDVKFKVACDVSNPFYGKEGAAFVYGEQKGATTNEIQLLDDGLRNFAKIIHTKYSIDIQQIRGAGAAGGIGGGAFAFLNGKLTSGIALIKDLSNFDSEIEGADWIITGEGRLDNQTLLGKTISGVIESAKLYHIPVAALCGSVNISVTEQEKLHLTYITSITTGPCSLEDALITSYSNLVGSAVNFARILAVAKGQFESP